MAALFVFDQRRRKQRIFKDSISSLDHLSDVEVVDRYRLSRIAIIYLEENLRNDVLPPTNRCYLGSELSKGNFLSEVADLHGILKQTASRVLHEFVDAVNRNIDNIRFPRTQQELAEAKLGFNKRFKIANIVGAVDGTLVPIIAPKVSGEAYISRKGFHAINVMATCSHDRRFIDIVAKWPGSQHYSSVMNTSSLKEHMESERPGMLLADSGYPLTTSLLTPLAYPVTPAEARYNNAQSKGRMVIEQSIKLRLSDVQGLLTSTLLQFHLTLHNDEHEAIFRDLVRPFGIKLRLSDVQGLLTSTLLQFHLTLHNDEHEAIFRDLKILMTLNRTMTMSVIRIVNSAISDTEEIQIDHEEIIESEQEWCGKKEFDQSES
ncbi:HARB1-like protein [Mya arenaria]|uniref:HARB1-like protein n=1 Tax=Mya arenaria TaxID=6604 RepID=A0ABY7EAI7_MYAAR|nr:HARB1-like protein [Mya arenaria]